MIERVDLGICAAYDYGGDGPTAVALPGAMLGGMPALWYAFEPLLDDGWRVVLVWDEFVDRSQDHWSWAGARLSAATGHAGGADLLIGKSLGIYGLAREKLPVVCLTPNLVDAELVDALRAREAPMLLVGGTDDPMWDGATARELSQDVLELADADLGLARTDQAGRVGAAVAAFSGRLRA